MDRYVITFQRKEFVDELLDKGIVHSKPNSITSKERIDLYNFVPMSFWYRWKRRGYSLESYPITLTDLIDERDRFSQYHDMSEMYMIQAAIPNGIGVIGIVDRLKINNQDTYALGHHEIVNDYFPLDWVIAIYKPNEYFYDRIYVDSRMSYFDNKEFYWSDVPDYFTYDQSIRVIRPDLVNMAFIQIRKKAALEQLLYRNGYTLEAFMSRNEVMYTMNALDILYSTWRNWTMDQLYEIWPVIKNQEVNLWESMQ